MVFLAAEALDFGHGQPGHADIGQRFAHFVQRERLDDGFDFFHGRSPSGRYFEVIGKRRSFPKLRGVMRGPGGAWRRLYSSRSTMRMTLRTTAASYPDATMSRAGRSRST